jgi:hypothetical protein
LSRRTSPSGNHWRDWTQAIEDLLGADPVPRRQRRRVRPDGAGRNRGIEVVHLDREDDHVRRGPETTGRPDLGDRRGSTGTIQVDDDSVSRAWPSIEAASHDRDVAPARGEGPCEQRADCPAADDEVGHVTGFASAG